MRDYREAVAEWIEREPWEMWLTLTVPWREQRVRESGELVRAPVEDQVFFGRMVRAFRRELAIAVHGRNQVKRHPDRCEIPMQWTLEGQKSGNLHAHGVVRGLQGKLQYNDVRDLWTTVVRRFMREAEGRHVYCHVQKFDRSKGGGRYMAKYIAKETDCETWHLSGARATG